MRKMVVLIMTLVLVLSALPAMAATNIDFWTVFTGDDGATIQKLVDEFNASQSDIVVKHTPIAADDMYTKLNLGAQTGSELPDVAICHVERIRKLVDTDVLGDVEYLFENGLSKDNYPATVLASTNFDGVQYGIPWDFNAGILYVNKDLVAKYGVESYLQDGYLTFDEIKEIGAIVNAKPDPCYITTMYSSYTGYLPRYEELGGKLTDDKGNLTIDPQIFAKMLETQREIVQLGYCPGVNDDEAALFYGNKLMFWEKGTWGVPTANKSGINYYCIPMPCYSPETSLMRSGSHTVVQPVDENRIEEEDKAVAAFIDWMGKNSIVWATEAGQVPLYKSVSENVDFTSLPTREFIRSTRSRQSCSADVASSVSPPSDNL
jgi:multiple sugar transport system substrate-binding protein